MQVDCIRFRASTIHIHVIKHKLRDNSVYKIVPANSISHQKNIFQNGTHNFDYTCVLPDRGHPTHSCQGVPQHYQQDLWVQWCWRFLHKLGVQLSWMPWYLSEQCKLPSLHLGWQQSGKMFVVHRDPWKFVLWKLSKWHNSNTAEAWKQWLCY